MSPNLSRRQYLKSLSIMGVTYSLVQAIPALTQVRSLSGTTRDIHIFSKHLQWLDYDAMARTAAQLGFDGVDLTVRPNGHVLPENVVRDLPKAVEAIRKAGLKADLLTTAITTTQNPNTETILKTASQSGIKIYRMGWLDFNLNKPIPEQLEGFKKQLKELAEMNKHFGLHGAYQNHAGTHVGASLWDIWYLIKDLDPKYLGVQFDIRHAMVESANAWQTGLQVLAPYIKSCDVKDFNWTSKEDKLTIENVPVGQGLVDFKAYFQRLDELHITGPLCLHMEYPLGGANDGAYKISVPATQVTDAMKADLMSLRKMMES